MTFTRLADDEVRALAAGFGLGEVASWRPIPAGTINSNFEVEAAAGRYFLRVNEGKSEADVRYEAALTTALAAAGVPTPPPLPCGAEPFARHGDRFVSLFAWVPGQHRDAAEVTAADAAEVGRALALLHVAARPVARRFERAGLYTYEQIVDRFRGFAASRDPALADAIAALRAEIAHLDAPDAAIARAAAARGVIHGDLFRDNVLFAGPAPSPLVALLDFEQASAGALVYDLAVCLNAWCWQADRIALPLVTALAGGYQSVRALDDAERAALPLELRAAAMRFCVTRITDVYLPGVDRPGKDFRSYLARLRAWRALGADGLRAALG